MMAFIKHSLLIMAITFLISGCSSDVQIDEVIVDEAHVIQMNDEVKEDYLDYNTYLLETFDIDFRVITTNSKEEINIFTHKRFLELQSRSKQGRTILLVLNIAQDKTRVEVSLYLEDIFTDGFISYVERKGMVPYFQDNKIADGVIMLSELIKDTAMDATLGKNDTKEKQSKSIGAGAKTQANIGQVDTKAKAGKGISVNSKDKPKDVLAKYFNSLKEHNKNPHLQIYTKQTQDFLAQWTVTDINQNNELRFTKNCTKGKYYFTSTNAVLLQPLKPRTCAPYFFKKEEGLWKLDIYTMAKVLKFNTQMMWHFDMHAKTQYLSDYEVFFQNLHYDENGFPFYNKRKKLKWGFTCESWISEDEKNKEKCWISWLDKNGKAKNALGLQLGDKIVKLGLEPQSLMNPSVDNMMNYMKNARKGETVSLEVIRDDKHVQLHTQL